MKKGKVLGIIMLVTICALSGCIDLDKPKNVITIESVGIIDAYQYFPDANRTIITISGTDPIPFYGEHPVEIGRMAKITYTNENWTIDYRLYSFVSIEYFDK